MSESTTTPLTTPLLGDGDGRDATTASHEAEAAAAFATSAGYGPDGPLHESLVDSASANDGPDGPLYESLVESASGSNGPDGPLYESLVDSAPSASAGNNDDDEDEGEGEGEGEDEGELKSIAAHMLKDWNWLHVLYLSLLSAFGISLRAYIGRFFGGDCEAASQGYPIDDFLWPVSSRICVTANGQTAQWGGALFVDMPANMFGSLVMGFFTGHNLRSSGGGDWPVLPCLHTDHPLQGNAGLHAGLRTAICGCLTTFSSWNTQMVLMMDGTANPYLGSQVLSALFGYVLGLQVAIVSFRAGRTLSSWFHLRTNPHIFDSALEKRVMRQHRYHHHLSWITPALIGFLFGTMVGLYMAADFYWGIPYYRHLWIACLVAPVGTILRWKLSTLNGRTFGSRGCCARWGGGAMLWFPVGTFLANFLASLLSAGCEAWDLTTHPPGAERWKIPVEQAISMGVAGSLSTVSTFVKECVEMGEKSEHYSKKVFVYSHGTMLVCCLFGLMVYSPIIRSH